MGSLTRKFCALGFVAVLCACGGGEAPLVHTYTVTITGSITPAPVRYSGSYQYHVDGKRVTKDLSGAGSLTFDFEGEELAYVRVHRTSADGIISLSVFQDGETIFDSPPNSTRQPIIFTPREQ